MDDLYYSVAAIERESFGHRTARHTQRIRVYNVLFYKIAPDICNEADFMYRLQQGYYAGFTDRWVTPEFARNPANRDTPFGF